jgi:anti-sigma-K factor RskA
MTGSEAKELIPLHALGALDASTARTVEAYLRNASAEEQREAAEFREVAALLPFASLAPAVPAALKGELLTGPHRLLPQDNAASGGPAQVLEFQSRAERSRSARLTQWLAVAAALVLAASSTFLYWQNSQLRSERTQMAQQLAQARQEIAQMQAPATRVVAMQGQAAPQASAKVFWDTERQQWIVTIFNLPAPPAGMDYQLWYVTKDAKLSAAVFRPNAQGQYELRLALPAGVPENLAATAVTLEPQGGSPQPTGKFYLLAQL